MKFKNNAKRSPLFGRRDDQRAGIIFALPFIIGFLLFFLRMLAVSIRFAFSSVGIGEKGYQLTFKGIENFRYALRVDANYIKIVASTIQSMAVSIPLILIFSLFIAVLLNQKIIGRTFFRVIFFLPVIVSTGLIAKMDSSNLVMTFMSDSATSSTGVMSAVGNIGELFQMLNFSPGFVTTISGFANDIYEIVNKSGVQILIFLAGIQSIPVSVYESANVEGATAWEIFWKITLPMVCPMLLVNVFYSVIDFLTADNSYLMTYIKGMVFTNGQYGVGAAMSWLYTAVVMLLLGLVFLVVRGILHAQEKAK